MSEGNFIKYMSKIDTFITPGQQHEHNKAKRKSPGPRYQHLRFFRLAVGERLDIGLVAYRKSGAFSARNCTTSALRRVMPWNKVRSRRLVKQPDGFVICGPLPRGERIQATYDGKRPFAPIGCQGDGGDRTPESIGGTEKTPSA